MTAPAPPAPTGGGRDPAKGYGSPAATGEGSDRAQRTGRP
jgi:hypothetical protein